MPPGEGERAAKQPARGAGGISSVWDRVHTTGEEPRSTPEQKGAQGGEEDRVQERSNPKPWGLAAGSSVATSDSSVSSGAWEGSQVSSLKCSKREFIKPNLCHEMHLQGRRPLGDTHSMICLASFSETSSLFGSRSIFSSVSWRLDSSSSSWGRSKDRGKIPFSQGNLLNCTFRKETK